MRAFLIFFFALISSPLISSTALAGDWYGPTFGGNGGRPRQVSCGPNGVLIGFTGRLGAYIDQLEIICRTVKLVRNEQGNVEVRTPDPPYPGGPSGTMGTSTGGQYFWPSYCNNDPYPRPVGSRYAAITFVAYGRSMALNSITLECQELWQSHNTNHFAGIGNTNGIRPIWLQCPQNQWLKGLYGRSGLFVDRIGPVCGPLNPVRL